MSLTVLAPGLITTVQDLGRYGYQQYGVPVSGAADPRSARLANLLVGNDENEAVLECTVLGPRLRFDGPAVIALTGGDLGARLDGRPLQRYRALAVKAGQELSFSGLRSGCRAYLAFAGGPDVPSVMGSRSTCMKAGLGGFKGRKLEKGDVLAFREEKETLPGMESRVLGEDFSPQKQYELHVVPGPQDDLFTEEGLRTFLGESYTVTAQSDRMGCRLEGPVIAHRGSADIISDGISFGAVQVPGDGKPIIMLADRQTTGGYTKIATVITADFRFLGQLKGGDTVRFKAVGIEQAQLLYRLEQQYFAGIRQYFQALR